MKESLWLIRTENKNKIIRASWSEMLDNSLHLLSTKRAESVFSDPRDVLSDDKEKAAGADKTKDCCGLALRFCATEELQLVMSYMIIGLAAGLLLPVSYWIVLKIYSYSFI